MGKQCCKYGFECIRYDRDVPAVRSRCIAHSSALFDIPNRNPKYAIYCEMDGVTIAGVELRSYNFLRICVSEGFRGMGIGACLLRIFIRELRLKGCGLVLLMMHPPNKPALRLFHQVGFKNCTVLESIKYTYQVTYQLDRKNSKSETVDDAPVPRGRELHLQRIGICYNGDVTTKVKIGVVRDRIFKQKEVLVAPEAERDYEINREIVLVHPEFLRGIFECEGANGSICMWLNGYLYECSVLKILPLRPYGKCFYRIALILGCLLRPSILSDIVFRLRDYLYGQY